MKKIIACVVLVLCLLPLAFASPVLQSTEKINGLSRDAMFESITDAYYSNGKVASLIGGNILWVPWFSTSSGSLVTDLQKGTNCNANVIDFSHNCMVTDELSQLGIVIAMGKDQTRMNQYYNTIVATKSTNGNIPSWRIFRDGDVIVPCKTGINSNCDTASDATARIIVSLFTAAKNPYFTDVTQRAKYESLARKLSDDMINYEVEKTCRPTDFGTVCNWLASGSESKRGGVKTTDFAYTGYYADAIIAMLAAYSNTNNNKYLTVANDFTKNYLQAAKFNNKDFSAPPGRSFSWVVNSNGVPVATCTNSCSPTVWDGFDAPRALGMCQAQYYAVEMGVELPGLKKYCEVLNAKHMSSATSAPIQFYPDGSAKAPVSGYYAQGLQSLHLIGTDAAKFKTAVDSAISHYSTTTKTFDYTASIGIYTTAFAVRALGMGIGRDSGAFKATSGTTVTTTTFAAPSNTTNTTTVTSPTTSTASGIATLKTSCTYNSVSGTMVGDVSSNGCRSMQCSTASGLIDVYACEKDNNYIEMYRRSAPSNLDFKFCLANGCVNKDSGYVKFQPTTTTQTTTQSTTTTTTVTNTSTTAQLDVSKLTITVKPSGTLVSDVMDGLTCRKVQYNTQYGWAEAKVCQKETKYEMYLLSTPNQASICVGSNCVGSASGFASFSS
ncbi:MAG TPA: hypothetical protein VK158_02505 [Acidobacteriota bacterium]|nr:hypothetical protein [Acidobacteriota bacterium]